MKNGQLACEAAYRCEDCQSIDKILRIHRDNPDLPARVLKDGDDSLDMTMFDDHLERKCRHHEFLDSSQTEWLQNLDGLDLDRYAQTLLFVSKFTVTYVYILNVLLVSEKSFCQRRTTNR